MRIFSIFAVLVIGVMSANLAHAASASPELRGAYEAMMRDPSNVTLNERYIKQALSLNDYEAAIAPLERLAMQDPSNMGYVLRIGEMFKALGSHKIAKGYFDKVIASSKSTPEQIARAKAAL